MMANNKTFRVTGDFDRMVYSSHKNFELALKAAKALAKKWGLSHPGSEPRVERLTDTGWKTVQ